MAPIDSYAIVGSGLVGCSWAVVLAKSGAAVRLFDARADVRDAESAFERVDVKAAVCAGIGERIAGTAVAGSSGSGLPASSFAETKRRAWAPELMEKAAAERRLAPPEAQPKERSVWRDRRLVHLVAHLRKGK